MYPEPVSGLTSSTSESSAVLQWSLQSSGSSPSLGVEVEVERGGTGEMISRLIVGADEAGVTLNSLQPLTSYNFTVYAVSQVGRSRPASVHDTTLSLSKAQLTSHK